VFLKRHVRRKDGKEHVYYSVCESIRLSCDRTIQRRVLNLGELNTTQIECWQRSIEVIEQEGQAAVDPCPSLIVVRPRLTALMARGQRRLRIGLRGDRRGLGWPD
jgi:hypothetical protein